MSSCSIAFVILWSSIFLLFDLLFHLFKVSPHLKKLISCGESCQVHQNLPEALPGNYICRSSCQKVVTESISGMR